MNEVLKVTIEALLVMITTILPVVAKYLVNLISISINAKKQSTQNASEKKILAAIDQLIADSVNYVSQTFVDSLKQDGDFSIENQKIALELALENIKSTLSEEAKEFIMINYGDMQTWLITKIEARIKENKQ